MRKSFVYFSFCAVGVIVIVSYSKEKRLVSVCAWQRERYLKVTGGWGAGGLRVAAVSLGDCKMVYLTSQVISGLCQQYIYKTSSPCF